MTRRRTRIKHVSDGLEGMTVEPANDSGIQKPKLVIVGGGAGGATAAARARRLNEHAKIVLIERGPDVSFANCGLPYHIGGEIASRAALLVQTKVGLSTRFALDIRTRSEVVAIDRQTQLVRVRDLNTGKEYEERYDYLLLSPGAVPVRPPIPGIDHPAVFTLRDLADMDRIKQMVDSGARAAVVVGGGFIGLELAENLRRRGLDVAVVELLPQVLPTLDPEMAAPLHTELRSHGVRLLLGNRVTSFTDTNEQVRVGLGDGGTLDADLVLLAVGVRPESALAEAAGLEVNEHGAIVVDEHMRTSDPHVYAVGDAVQVRDPVLGGFATVPLAGPANRQARIAVDNIFGRSSRYRGTQGTSIARVFGLTAAATGASEKTLCRHGIACRKVHVHRSQHVGYFPGAEQMAIKLLFAPDDGRILGAQIVGGEGVDRRIDVLAVAIQAGLTVYDLEEAELAYAPPYGAAKDPVNIAGFVASNVLRGDDELVYAEELGNPSPARWTVVDVRDPAEFAADHIPGALLIPLPELRDRRHEIPRDQPIAVYCLSGQRSYYAARILRQNGILCRNLSGGMLTYRCAYPVEP